MDMRWSVRRNSPGERASGRASERERASERGPHSGIASAAPHSSIVADPHAARARASESASARGRENGARQIVQGNRKG